MRFLINFILVLIFSFSVHAVFGQHMPDTLASLYSQYFKLEKTTKKLESKLKKNQVMEGDFVRLEDSLQTLLNQLSNLQKTTQTLESQLDKNSKHFHEVLESNNASIRKISNVQLFTNKVLLNRNQIRVINSAEFVEAANVSLNTLNLTQEVFNYTNLITALNSPNNTELGFSLNRQLQKILDETIFKHQAKVNRVKKDKFMAVVKGVVNTPFVNTVTQSVPVVGALKSVVDLVLGITIRGDDVNPDDVNKFRKEMQVYLDYYEGLENARVKFDNKLNNIVVRTEALKLLLRNFTIERIGDLYPKDKKNVMEMSLNQLIADYYNYKSVEYEIEKIIGEYNKNNEIQYEKALSDSRLLFPDFAVSQARFILDEIEGISSEYEAALNSYQRDIELVLKKSESIGKADKIQKKIVSLKESKKAVVKAIKVSLNVPQVKRSYQAILANA
ncbi:MAG: hypothetical protein GY705_26445 [Bacteroidetes bacterium]|nr:hypothetical protein [Bacteroidota bacterium]